MKDIPEVHQTGTLTLENFGAIFPHGPSMLRKVDVGLQMSKDGRIWLCVNGTALIRFTPHLNGKMHAD
jgi:hypothetical protein